MGDPACHMPSICLSCGRYLNRIEEIEQNCSHCRGRADSQPMYARASRMGSREAREDTVRQEEGFRAF